MRCPNRGQVITPQFHIAETQTSPSSRHRCQGWISGLIMQSLQHLIPEEPNRDSVIPNGGSMGQKGIQKLREQSGEAPSKMTVFLVNMQTNLCRGVNL